MSFAGATPDMVIKNLVNQLRIVDGDGGVAMHMKDVELAEEELKSAREAVKRGQQYRAELREVLRDFAATDPEDCSVCGAMNDDGCPKHGV